MVLPLTEKNRKGPKNEQPQKRGSVCYCCAKFVTTSNYKKDLVLGLIKSVRDFLHMNLIKRDAVLFFVIDTTKSEAVMRIMGEFGLSSWTKRTMKSPKSL